MPQFSKKTGFVLGCTCGTRTFVHFRGDYRFEKHLHREPVRVPSVIPAGIYSRVVSLVKNTVGSFVRELERRFSKNQLVVQAPGFVSCRRSVIAALSQRYRSR